MAPAKALPHGGSGACPALPAIEATFVSLEYGYKPGKESLLKSKSYRGRKTLGQQEVGSSK